MTPDPARAEVEALIYPIIVPYVTAMESGTQQQVGQHIARRIADALLTREREVRRLALEEAAQIIEHKWYPTVGGYPDCDELTQAIRARAKEAEHE